MPAPRRTDSKDRTTTTRAGARARRAKPPRVRGSALSAASIEARTDLNRRPPPATRKSFADKVKHAPETAPAAPATQRLREREESHQPATPAPSTHKPNPHPTSNFQHPTSHRNTNGPAPGFIAVGRILGPFGLKGELKVLSLTDNVRRFRPKSRLWAGAQPVTVAAAREAGGYVYLMLKGFLDRRGVEKFRHSLLQVPESDLPPLAQGEYYRYQLIGLTVADATGAVLGTLDEIIETGSNDVYRVRALSGTDVLLPARPDVVLSVDLDARRVVVDPPEWV